jgi:hypothetical protein
VAANQLFVLIWCWLWEVAVRERSLWLPVCCNPGKTLCSHHLFFLHFNSLFSTGCFQTLQSAALEAGPTLTRPIHSKFCFHPHWDLCVLGWVPECIETNACKWVGRLNYVLRIKSIGWNGTFFINKSCPSALLSESEHGLGYCYPSIRGPHMIQKMKNKKLCIVQCVSTCSH